MQYSHSTWFLDVRTSIPVNGAKRRKAEDG